MACDVGDEASVAVAAQALGPVDLALVATGALTLPGGAGPEKTWRSLDPAVMAVFHTMAAAVFKQLENSSEDDARALLEERVRQHFAR